jgi:hypothetical protein
MNLSLEKGAYLEKGRTAACYKVLSSQSQRAVLLGAKDRDHEHGGGLIGSRVYRDVHP